MSEKTKKKPRTTPKISGKTTLETTTNALLHMFDRAMGLLEATVNAGKINPSQGLLGMILVADLLHGGAYVGPSADRPALGGKTSKYYQPISISNPELYPMTGFNILDPLGSFFNIFGATAESTYAQAIVQEVYLNANVPHKFPKLLSDEAYAKILVIASYLTHTDVVTKNANGIKTLVEASAIPIKTVGEAIEAATPSGEQLKQLLPLLSLVE